MDTTTSRVLADIEMSGSMKFAGGVIFEGKFDGGFIEGDWLTVAEGAEIRAEIVVANLTIAGRVEGDVAVSDRCQLTATAYLQGNLKTARLVMDDGATFAGAMEISRPAKATITARG